MAHACKDARAEIEAADLGSKIDVASASFQSTEQVARTLVAHDASYVDVVVQPVIDKAANIVEKTGKVLGIWHRAFRRHALTMNLKKGKTEIVMQWCGDGAVAARQIFEANGSTSIHVESNGISLSAHTVTDYNHLGQRWASASHMGPEVATKAAAIHSACRSNGRRLLRNPAIPVERRQNMSAQLCLSTGLWSAAPWPLLTPAQDQRIHHAIMSPMRMIHDCHYGQPDQNMSDEMLLLQTGAMPPVVLLRMLRVLLFVRMCSNAPNFLLEWIWTSLADSASWASTVGKHLEHLACTSKVFEDCGGWSLQQWYTCAHENSRSLPKSVVKAYRALEPRGWVTSKAQEISMRKWPCAECSKIFGSSTALAAHRAKSHNVKNTARNLAFGTQRPSCLVEFHTRYRVVVHLAYRSPVCHAIAKIDMEPMLDEEAELLDEKDRPEMRALARTGRGAEFAKVACCQAHGPLWETSYQHDAYDPAGPSLGSYPPLRRKCDRKAGVTTWSSTHGCPASLVELCTHACIICKGQVA